MIIFVAASYSANVDYATGRVYPAYKDWLESLLAQLEGAGYAVFCALREDGYVINTGDPAAAFRVDIDSLQKSDVLLALLDANTSAGVQLEVGYALALHKKVVLAHASQHKLSYINDAAVRAGLASELTIPLTTEALRAMFSGAL